MFRKHCSEVIQLNGKRGAIEAFGEMKAEPNKDTNKKINRNVAEWFEKNVQDENEIDYQNPQEQTLKFKFFLKDPSMPKYSSSKKGYNDYYRVCMQRYCGHAKTNWQTLKCAVNNLCSVTK